MYTVSPLSWQIHILCFGSEMVSGWRTKEGMQSTHWKNPTPTLAMMTAEGKASLSIHATEEGRRGRADLR